MRFKEPTELLGPVSFCLVGDHLAGGHIESGVEAGRSVTDVVMSASFRQTRTKRQHRRRAVQGLDLGLFVYAEHHGTVGRIDIWKPTMSRTFSMNWGSGETLKASTRCGFNRTPARSCWPPTGSIRWPWPSTASTNAWR